MFSLAFVPKGISQEKNFRTISFNFLWHLGLWKRNISKTHAFQNQSGIISVV